MTLFRQYIRQSGNRSNSGLRVDRTALRQACLQLALLERGGVRITDSLRQMTRHAPSPRLRQMFGAVSAEVFAGETLSAALSRYPRLFGPVFLTLIRAGEGSGNLRTAFEDIAAQLQWQQEMQRKIAQALRYPAVLLLAILAVIGGLMTFLVPRILEFLTFLQQDLPLATRSLMAVSAFMQTTGIWILALGGMILVLALLGRRLAGPLALRIDALLLRLPFFGPALYGLDLWQFSTLMALTSARYHAVQDNLRLCADVVRNAALRQRLLAAGQDLEQGQSLAAAFAARGILDPLAQKILEIGEHSSDIATAFTEISRYYGDEINTRISRVGNLLKPALLFFAAAILIWVILGTLLPLYDIMERMPT
jgi:type IV pilus assembly protein PilC